MCPLFSFGQTTLLSGLWKGTITQNEGGYRSTYDLELYIFQDGKEISGRSYVMVDNIYAEMVIEGDVKANLYLKIRDTHILDHQEREGMEWCIKDYQLLLKREGELLRLEGLWQGSTSFSTCVPGKINLKKVSPRA